MRLRTKLLIALASLGLVPCIVLGVFSYTTAARAVREKVDGLTAADLARITRSVEEAVERVALSKVWFAGNEAFVQSLAALDAAAAPGDAYALAQRLDRMVAGYLSAGTTIDALGFVTLAGVAYGWNLTPAAVRSILGEGGRTAIAAANGQVVWSGPVTDPSPLRRGEPSWIAGWLLRDTVDRADTRPLGTLLFVVPGRYFASLVRSEADDGLTLLALPDGRIVAADEGGAPDSLARSEAWSAVAALERGLLPVRAGGQSWIAAVETVRSTGWKLVRLLPAGYATSELGSIALVDAALVLGCLAAVAAVAALLSRLFSRPVRELAAALERVGSRDFSATVPVRGRDELGAIASGFNAMAAQLERLFTAEVEREREIQRAKLRALRYQVNPHLIANTIGAIRLTALADGAGRVAEMLAVLARLLRRTLARTGDRLTLGEEVAGLRDWLAVLQLRYLDRIGVAIEVPEELLDCRVPPMILQPLAENAVLHGLSARLNEPAGAARLRLTASAADGRLVLEVRDNGSGMNAEQIAAAYARAAESEQGGEQPAAIGIPNIQRRLRAEFGGAASLEIESTPGVGTVARVTLPEDRGG